MYAIAFSLFSLFLVVNIPEHRVPFYLIHLKNLKCALFEVRKVLTEWDLRWRRFGLDGKPTVEQLPVARTSDQIRDLKIWLSLTTKERTELSYRGTKANFETLNFNKTFEHAAFQVSSDENFSHKKKIYFIGTCAILTLLCLVFGIIEVFMTIGGIICFVAALLLLDAGSSGVQTQHAVYFNQNTGEVEHQVHRGGLPPSNHIRSRVGTNQTHEPTNYLRRIK